MSSGYGDNPGLPNARMPPRVRWANDRFGPLTDWLSGLPTGLKVRDKPLGRNLRQMALEQANEGIHVYDEFLFKIRSWWIGLSTLFVGGFLGLRSETVKGSAATVEKEPLLGMADLGMVFFFLVCFGICFWIIDAMNKSLQMVQIHMARDLEQGQLFDLPSYSVTKARRYSLRSGRHIKSLIGQLGEESVWLFYLVPLAAYGIILGIFSLKDNTKDPLQEILYVNTWAVAAVLAVMAMLVFAKVTTDLPFLIRLLRGVSQRAQKRFLRECLKQSAKAELGRDMQLVRLRGFQFHLTTDSKKAVFLDYSRTWGEPSFVVERNRMAEDLALEPIYVDVGRNLCRVGNGPFEQAEDATVVGKIIAEIGTDVGIRLNAEEVAERFTQAQENRGWRRQLLVGFVSVVAVLLAVLNLPDFSAIAVADPYNLFDATLYAILAAVISCFSRFKPEEVGGSLFTLALGLLVSSQLLAGDATTYVMQIAPQAGGILLGLFIAEALKHQRWRKVSPPQARVWRSPPSGTSG